MISDLRKHLQGVASKIVLWITIIALAGAFSLPTLFRQTMGGGSWAIRVNREEIPSTDFVREVSEQRERLIAFRTQYGQYADLLLQSMGMDFNPKTLAFDLLVKEELINQFGDKIGLYLHPDYIVDQLQDQLFVGQELGGLIPPDIIDQFGSINKRLLHAYLKRRGYTVEAFNRKVERVLTRKMVMELVANALYIPTFDITLQYIADYAAKKYSILTFSLDSFIKEEKKKEVTDQEFKNFFDQQNKKSKQYWVPEKRSGKVWKFDHQSYNIIVTNEEITQYYDDNKTKLFVESPTTIEVRHIVLFLDNDKNYQTVKEKAEKIRRELIENPDKFAAIAQKESDDQETAKNGGLLAPFSRGEKEKSFERAAFLLTEDGAISDVVETPRGLEIIQRISKKMQAFKPLKSVEKEIENKLKEAKFKELFVADMKKVLEASDESEREVALEKFIKAKGGKPESVDGQIQDETELAKHLFKLDKNDIAFYIDNQTGVAVKLTDIKQSYLPNFDTIKQTVLNDFYEEQAMQKLKQRLEEAKKAAENKSPEEVFKAHLEKTGWLKKDDTSSIEALEKKGVPVTQMLQIEKTGGMFTHIADGKGYLVRLDDIEPFNQEEFNAKQQEIESALSDERTRVFVEGFVASLYRNATIETNESILNLQE